MQQTETFLQSADGEYIYHLYDYRKDQKSYIITILNKDLESIAHKEWTEDYIKEMLDSGSIVPYKKEE